MEFESILTESQSVVLTANTKVTPKQSMVPRDRIELPSAPCKGAALPLDERGKLVPHDRIELPSTDYKTAVLPLY